MEVVVEVEAEVELEAKVEVELVVEMEVVKVVEAELPAWISISSFSFADRPAVARPGPYFSLICSTALTRSWPG